MQARRLKPFFHLREWFMENKLSKILADLYQADYLFACAEANEEDVTTIRQLIYSLREQITNYERELESRS